MARRRKIRLDRRDVVAQILASRGDALLVAGLGGTVWDSAAAGDHDNNFYLWGAMGAAAMMGLGLALAQPQRRVVVITGDGEMLMGLGSLATIGVRSPRNLAIAVIDNELYGETGMQATHTGFGVDLAAIASAARFRHARCVYSQREVDEIVPLLLNKAGPVFVDIKVGEEVQRGVLPPKHGPYLKERFRRAVLESV